MSGLQFKQLKNVTQVIGKPNTELLFKKCSGKSKEFAFQKANYLSNQEKPFWKDGKIMINRWRVGITTSQYIFVEVDNPDIMNVKGFYKYITELLGLNFTIFKTLHGYHLVSEKILEFNFLLFNCMILNKNVCLDNYKPYADQVIAYDNEHTKMDKVSLVSEFKRTDLYDSDCFFDVLYTILSIKYGKSTFRISKKVNGDKYEEL